MTSPAGGTAASGDAAQNGQNGGGEADAQQSGPDLGALAEQLGQMSQGQEEMRNFLMSQPWAQQEAAQSDEGAGDQQADGIDLSFLDDAYGVDQQTATQLADVIERQMQQREAALKQEFQKQLEGVTERVSERERMEQMRDLVDEFPDMADPDVAKPIVGQAHSLVEANGWPETLAADPRFWRVVYAAQQAFAAAQDEGGEDSQAAHLEGGAGAASAGGQRGDDITQILDGQAQSGRFSSIPFP